jgi:site-specific DNA recombinase
LEPAEAAVVAEIFACYLEPGASLLQVARTLRERQIQTPTGKLVWGLATVRGILRNPAYTGQVYTGRMRYRPPSIRRSATHPIGRSHDSGTLVPPAEWIPVATIPAIVTQAQFDLTQSKLAKNRSFARRNNTAHPYLLRALVSCGHCRLACIGRTLAHSPYSYYMCSGKFKKSAMGRTHCPSRFAPAGQLEDLVWQDLCEVLTHPAELAQALERAHGGQWLPQELQARHENLRKGRASLGQQLDRLTEAYLHNIIPLPEYERRRRELEQREQALAEQEVQLCAQAERHEEIAGLAIAIDDFCARVQAGLINANFEQKRQLIELLVDRVIVTDTEVEIRYVIPTHPRSEHIRFCHLRTDYFHDPHLVWRHRIEPLFQQVGSHRQIMS